LGGNRRFNEFMKEHGIPEDMPIREKYSTRAAKWYRENLRARAEESTPLAPLPTGTGHLPADDSVSDLRSVLDQVFAEASCSNAMSPSCTFHDEVPHEVSTSISRSLCEKLCACFRQGRHSAPKVPVCQATRHSSEARQLLVETPLPVLLGSMQCPTAKRLQMASSGKMEGFGSM